MEYEEEKWNQAKNRTMWITQVQYPIQNDEEMIPSNNLSNASSSNDEWGSI